MNDLESVIVEMNKTNLELRQENEQLSESVRLLSDEYTKRLDVDTKNEQLKKENEQLKQTITQLQGTISNMAEYLTSDSTSKFCTTEVDCRVTECIDCVVKHFEEVEIGGIKVTNYEKIMQEMTVEKLAGLGLCEFCPHNDIDDYCCRRFNCKDESKKWLELEAEK